jgi:hypothetical protein
VSKTSNLTSFLFLLKSTVVVQNIEMTISLTNTIPEFNEENVYDNKCLWQQQIQTLSTKLENNLTFNTQKNIRHGNSSFMVLRKQITSAKPKPLRLLWTSFTEHLNNIFIIISYRNKYWPNSTNINRTRTISNLIQFPKQNQLKRLKSGNYFKDRNMTKTTIQQGRKATKCDKLFKHMENLIRHNNRIFTWLILFRLRQSFQRAQSRSQLCYL